MVLCIEISHKIFLYLLRAGGCMSNVSFDNSLTKLTGFQRDIVVGLAWFERVHGENSVRGQDLGELLTDQYESKIHNGRLYPNLDTVITKGLVNKVDSEEDISPDAAYTLSQEGNSDIKDYYQSLSLMMG